MATNNLSIPKKRKRFSIAATVILLLFAGFALFGGIHFKLYTAPYPSYGKAVAWAIGIPEPAYNFDTVLPAKLYRSGVPDGRFLEYVHRKYGIRYLVSLIGPVESHTAARNIGMKVTVFDWRTRPPTTQELKSLLDFLAKKDGVLVHCNAGRDRTGYAIAMLRVQQQHWPVERAIDEMEGHGHARSRHPETSRLLHQWIDELKS